MDRSEFTSAFIDQLPQLDELTELLSAPLAGGTHLILTNDNPWDNSIYQFYLDREGKIIDSAVHDVGHSLGHEFNTGDVVGAGVLLGSIPENLTFVRHTRCPYRLDFFFSDLSADPDHESHVLSFYRHVWPGVPVEVEALSTIVGPFSPEIVARIELEIDHSTYVLATMRRLPRGVNALDYTREGLAAQVVSHTQGIELGRTLRFLHDSLLLAFPYEWASAAEHMQRLEDRLDDFVHMAPRLAEYAPWIRDWYRSLDGEMLVQRLHGNVNLKQMWLGPDERWVIGGWAGEVVAPMEERARLGCPLEDLASLQRSMFWACRGNKAWCIKAMAAIFEGYGEPMMSALFSAFVLDRACKEVAEETMSADGEPDLPFEFLEWFREVALPTRETMEPSSFLRPA